METTKSFTCCGGSDENTPEHTQDCPDFGNPKWLTKLHESEMKFVGEQLTSSKARIASLEAQLEKAEKVIEFYADENGNSDSDREDFYIEYHGKEMLITKLGKKAREYFAEKEKK